MEIYKIEDYKKNRKLVYLEEGTPAFCLYKKEIEQFALEEGKEIEAGVYDELISLLSKRARERCLYLLDDMSRTEYQLRSRLKDGFYPEEAVENAISYCKEKHYIDDRDYAERYVSIKSDTLSVCMIKRKLLEKGISREIISEVLEDSDITEADTVRRLIQRKYGDISGYDDEQKQKLIRRLLSRGFGYDSIKKAVERDI